MLLSVPGLKIKFLRSQNNIRVVRVQCSYGGSALREHLRPYTYVPYLSHSLLYLINFIREFHHQMIKFV